MNHAKLKISKERGGGGSLVTKSCLTLVTPWTSCARLLCPWDSPEKNTGAGEEHGSEQLRITDVDVICFQQTSYITINLHC